MPWAALRPCGPTCPELVRDGEPCPVHGDKRISDRIVSGWQERPSSTADRRVRGRAGMKLRWEVMSEEPRSAICGGWGHDDDQMDHIDGNVSNNARSNRRRVHRECHKPLIHAQSLRARGLR